MLYSGRLPRQQATSNTQQATSPHEQNGDIKHFVLDTNVLLHNPNALFMFKENEVIIPFDVIEELDKFKAGTDDLGRNARTVIRHLDYLAARRGIWRKVSLPGTTCVTPASDSGRGSKALRRIDRQHT